MKIFNFLENCKRHLNGFFEEKEKKGFGEDGIMRMHERWSDWKIVEQNSKIVQ